MKNYKWFLLFITIIGIVVFFFPKNCGYWSSWGKPSSMCDCLGFKYTPSGFYDGGPHLCFGIKK